MTKLLETEALKVINKDGVLTLETKDGYQIPFTRNIIIGQDIDEAHEGLSSVTVELIARTK